MGHRRINIPWLPPAVVLLLVAIPPYSTAQQVNGADVNREETDVMATISASGPGDRLVIAAIRPAATDKFGRAAGKATVKKMAGRRIVVIGGYWPEDPSWAMPGGGSTSVREHGGIQILRNGLVDYVGAARDVEPGEKLTDLLPMSAGSIIRFIGSVAFEGCTFDGSENDPLSFGLVDGVGFVYLRGSGTVTLAGGQVRKLGSR